MGEPTHNKISSTFASRLGEMDGGRRVTVIVKLNTPRPGHAVRRRSLSERQLIIGQKIAAGRRALPEIDRILEEHGGRRLSDSVTALGTVAIEATPAGVRALARSPLVKAIMENQGVHFTG